MPWQAGLGPLVVAVAALAAYVVGRARCEGARLVLVWWAVALPFASVLLGTLYHSLLKLYAPVLVVVAAVLLARIDPRRASALAWAIGALAVGCTLVQHARSREQALGYGRGVAPQRVFYLQLAEALLAHDHRQRYGLLFEAWDTHFYNYAFYDRGVAPTGTVAYHTVVDSYYRQEFPGLSAEGIAQENARRLESRVGTMAVGHCEPDTIPDAVGYQPLAREVAVRITRHLRQSPRWRALRRFDSPYGCLYLYEWTSADLPRRKKWRAVREITDGP